jgi:hypothetical protein
MGERFGRRHRQTLLTGLKVAKNGMAGKAIPTAVDAINLCLYHAVGIRQQILQHESNSQSLSAVSAFMGGKRLLKSEGE